MYDTIAREWIEKYGMEHENAETVTENWFEQHCWEPDEVIDAMDKALCEELVKLA